MDFLFTPEAISSLLTLTFLEIILGIDNIVFISIVVGKLPEHKRKRATHIGLILALVLRIALLDLEAETLRQAQILEGSLRNT